MRNLPHKLAVARGEHPAELLFKNGRLVNVLSGEIHETSIAEKDGRIIGLGDYKGRKTIDLRGSYIAPSLIDGHFHVESSQLTAPEFARAMGCKLEASFMTLSFLSLSPIPELKLTDQGLIDAVKLCKTSLFV